MDGHLRISEQDPLKQGLKPHTLIILPNLLKNS